jgi:hypothetical protein
MQRPAYVVTNLNVYGAPRQPRHPPTALPQRPPRTTGPSRTTQIGRERAFASRRSSGPERATFGAEISPGEAAGQPAFYPRCAAFALRGPRNCAPRGASGPAAPGPAKCSDSERQRSLVSRGIMTLYAPAPRAPSRRPAAHERPVRAAPLRSPDPDDEPLNRTRAPEPGCPNPERPSPHAPTFAQEPAGAAAAGGVSVGPARGMHGTRAAHSPSDAYRCANMH